MSPQVEAVEFCGPDAGERAERHGKLGLARRIEVGLIEPDSGDDVAGVGQDGERLIKRRGGGGEGDSRRLSQDADRAAIVGEFSRGESMSMAGAVGELTGNALGDGPRLVEVGNGLPLALPGFRVGEGPAVVFFPTLE